MDWNLAIEKNRDALKRTLAMLVAMAGLSVLRTGTGAGVAGGDHPNTLPRHLHRLVLRLLRPAEAAARRLVIIAARGLVVELTPPRPQKPKSKSIFVRNGVGTGIVLAPGSRLDRARFASGPRALSLPLLDPLKRHGIRRGVKPRFMPRISFLDDQPLNPLFHRPREPHPVPPPRSPDDLLDASRLNRRLEAVGRALDDLPHQAKRLARWRARLERASMQSRSNDAAGAQGGNTGRVGRLSPLRPGHPPGWRRRPAHAVDQILNELHALAVWARESPDTS
jgi:hypothetical protein